MPIQIKTDLACKQNHDLETGTNCLGPHLLTLLLEPILITTAASPNMPPGSVRIVWVVSLMTGANIPGGMNLDSKGEPVYCTPFMENYMQSKVGCAWLTDLYAKRLASKGILSVVRLPL